MRVDGERLRELRNDELLTQTQLAQLAHVALDTVWRLENGITGGSETSIRKIARALGVEPKELVGRTRASV
jgi:transcriptional regulator with XRE-family HTH domain